MPTDENSVDGDSVDSLPDDDDVNSNLKLLFSPARNLQDSAVLIESVGAFVNLTAMFVSEACPDVMSGTMLRFDFVAAQAMIRRFHRDAYGVKRFHDFLNDLVEQDKLSPAVRGEIAAKLPSLGIRINTASPRKTKVAAAFSLWASVLRPVCLSQETVRLLGAGKADTFCASVNFWIATTYLSRFGTVDLWPDDDASVRIGRIRYDFTYRAINLSSLEMLYASIFRKR